MSERCPHCGGTGQLRYDNRRTERDPRYHFVGRPYRCNFCWGTGRADWRPPAPHESKEER